MIDELEKSTKCEYRLYGSTHTLPNGMNCLSIGIRSVGFLNDEPVFRAAEGCKHIEPVLRLPKEADDVRYTFRKELQDMIQNLQLMIDCLDKRIVLETDINPTPKEEIPFTPSHEGYSRRLVKEALEKRRAAIIHN